ncbi:MAG: hypothetical protein Fur0041_22710 [Bacteroidia bacterium]
MSDHKPLFEEKQYQGLNRHSMVRRMLLAVFCFVAHYWSEHPQPVNLTFFRLGEYPGNDENGKLFFILGLVVMIFSVVLLFVLHMRTTVHHGAIVLESLWTARKVRIDLKGIRSVKKTRLKPSLFNRPVYNLHTKGKIRFYTHGNDAIELTTEDGLVYRIGTQRPEEFLLVLKKEMEKH